MPAARPTSPARLGLVLAVTLLLPAVVGAPAASLGAPPAAQATALVSATPTAAQAALPAAARADVRQPTVREVRLTGIDRTLLAKAPEPDDHVHGTLGTLSASPRLKPAVAAKVRISSPAALVAVTADKDFPAGTSIQVRVKEKKHGWSRWITLHVDPEHGPDPGSAEARRARPGSDPLMTVDAVKAQVRIDTPTGKVPRGTELTLVNAPTATADSATGRVSALSVGQPAIITRAQWGADESLRSRAPYYTDQIRAGFVHHTASTSNYSEAQAAAQVRAIYAYHTKSLGHSDIDYNFVVDRFGRLYEGRYGGMDRPVLGGHTAGFNENSFAVVGLGNFETFSPAAADMARIKDSIAQLFAWKLGLSGVNPSATVKLVSAGYIKATKYPKGSIATISATSSHQTVNYTSCPGKYLQAQLPSIRTLASGYSDVVISAPSPPIDAFQSGSRSSVALTAHTTRAVTWTADVLSPCSDTPVRSFSGSTAGAGQIDVTWDLRDSAGNPVLPATYTVRMTGSAADGTPVPPVSGALTITPAPGGQWGPCANASRVVGANSAATSVLWGRIATPSATTVVLTAPADAGPSAHAAGLAAAPLARSLGAPVLLTPGTTLAAEVAAEITARRATEVLVVGGPSVVSDSVVSAVAGLGASVTRLAGATDAATAAAVAARMPASTSAVLVSPTGSPAHATAGAALAAASGVPILLADGAAIPAETSAALAGRASVTVAASTALADATIAAAMPGIAWQRLVGPDAVSASLAVAAAFPGSPESAMLLPEDPTRWGTASAVAATGVPLLFTPSPVLAQGVADFLAARPALRATTTSVSAGSLDDQVLGATSRVLLGLPWSPPGVTTAPVVRTPTATATRKVARTNAKPEPVRKGRTVTATSKVTAKYTDGKYRAAPAGIPVALQFKASGTKKYKVVARGTTTAGRATLTAKATKSGRWRIVVGSRAAASDYVRVKR
jgi:hypothetical protein